MLGCLEAGHPNAGVMLSTINELFEQLKTRVEHYGMDGSYSWNVTVSYVEIYNEVVRDLLVAGEYKEVQLRAAPDGGVQMAGLTGRTVVTPTQARMTTVKKPTCF